MKRLLREPLLHFLLLGAALFGLYAASDRGREPTTPEIVITAGQIDHLAATFGKVWQRPPSASELKGLIDQYVKEEVLSREAVKLGLDRNDTVIRRRLQQKMEFLAEDFVAARTPTESELEEYLADHPDQFRQERRYSFIQLFLNPEKRGDQIDEDAAMILAGLKEGSSEADLEQLGDRLLLPREFSNEPLSSIASQFGSEFAAALSGASQGVWSGPIRSGYGLHLVRITDRTEGSVPSLEDVRPQVERELINTRRQAANRRFFEELLAKYHVTIEWPEPEPTQSAQAVLPDR